jgi:hypothetical protein
MGKSIFGIMAFIVMGCASGPDSGSQSSMVFNGNMQKARTAAEKSFEALGFEIQSKDERCMQGRKPLKSGFFISSGGESVTTCFVASGNKVKVQVQTKKTAFGFLGQENWDNRFLDEIKKQEASSG